VEKHTAIICHLKRFTKDR